MVHVSVEVQFTLLQNAYSALFAYAQDYGLSDPEAAVVVAEWEALFLPIKQHIESDLKMIAKGKAVTMPMSYIKDTSILGKLPSNPMARGKKPPPPPPPAGDGASPPPPGGRENHRIGSGDIGRQNHRIGSGDMGRQKSSTSLSSRFSRSDSSPPPVPRTRPTAPPSESPSPPRTAEHKPSVARIGSYGSGMGGGGVTPTPLAGLRPSALRSGSSPSAYGNGSSPSAHGNGIGGSSSPHAALAAATSGRIGRSLTPASRSPASGRSPSPSQLAEIVAGKKKPPPPPPKKKFGAAKNEVWVKALFTFEGQDRGDLGFVEGERIRVLKKTESMDGELCSLFLFYNWIAGTDLWVDWWEGEVGERKGQFPANYCELIK